MKRKCRYCKKKKELAEFVISNRYKEGYSYMCKECRKPISKEAWIKWKKKHPYKAKRFFKMYGLTEEDYESLLKSHRNKCKICGSSLKRLCVLEGIQ